MTTTTNTLQARIDDLIALLDVAEHDLGRAIAAEERFISSVLIALDEGLADVIHTMIRQRLCYRARWPR